MRVVHAEDYAEPRDAIAWDWFKWVNEIFPQLDLMLLPNLGRAVVDYFERWQLEGLILSGGNSIATEPLRDQTELALLDFAKAKNIPTLGVCRGLQLMQRWAGGSLKPLSGHVGKSHEIRFLNNRFSSGKNCYKVNSFHTMGLEVAAPDLEAMAICSRDGSIEALTHRHCRMTAIMWHPERPGGCEIDTQIFRYALGF